jgi:hypothetical protein
MDKFLLSYCAGGNETFTRLRALFVERRQDIVLAWMQPPSSVLKQYAETHPAGFCSYPDVNERARFWDAYLSERACIIDDSVPSAYLSEMDQGLYGGLVGGRVNFLSDPGTGWISSMVAPILRDWNEFPRLKFDPECEWFKRYLNQLEIFEKVGRGKFGISHFILINGLNFVFELFGATKTYLDLILNPGMVRNACRFALELNFIVQDTFFQKIPLVCGGTCSNMVGWIPGRIVSESVDPFHMTSVEYFEEWGRGQLEETFAHYDGGVVHVHGNGRHLLGSLSRVKGLKAIYLGDDRGFPPAFEVLKDIRSAVGDLPLVLTVSYMQFQQALTSHNLPGGILYIVSDVPDIEEANRCMEKVRQYRPPS